MNPKLAASLNPVLANPIVNGLILSNIKVVAGANTLNHTLGRKLQGYVVILNSAAVTYYDNQSTNQKPELTLILVSSGSATISLYVF